LQEGDEGKSGQDCRQQEGCAPVRHKADAGECLEEIGVAPGNDQVTRQCQRTPDARRRTVYGCDDRDWQIPHGEKQRIIPGLQRCAEIRTFGIRRDRVARGEVSAGAECAFGSGQKDASRGRRCVVQSGMECAHGFRRQGIHAFGPVDPDDRHVALCLGHYVRTCHARSPSFSAKG